MSIFRIIFLLAFFACLTGCSVSKQLVSGNEVSIVKELKLKHSSSNLETSTLSFFLFDKDNKTLRNVASLIFINNIQFKSDQNQQYNIEVLPGGYNIQIISVGYYPQKLRIKTEKGYNYKVTLSWQSTTEVLN